MSEHATLLTREIPDGTTKDTLEWDQGTFMAIAAFTAVCWYNVLELNVQVFLTFKRRRGLYFWSLLISSYGCVLHALGFLLKFFVKNAVHPSVTIITIGWYAMVTGQSVVLYSRLHLVVREQRILTGILCLIIIDALVFHIPTTVLTFISNTRVPNAKDDPIINAFKIYEKLQMTGFCIQEFIISGVYVWATISLLKPVYRGRTRKVMTQLIWINLIIIGMDICLLVMEYSDIYVIEATLKGMVYSIKLKLEFAVLNQLMTLANSSVNNHQNLHIENDSEKPSKNIPGRSKSTEYISNKYRRPKKRPNAAMPPGTGQGMQKSYSTSRMPDHRTASFKPPHPNRFQWGSDMDKDIALIEKKPRKKVSKEDLNLITNPAAYYGRGRRRSPVDSYPGTDGLGGIADSPVLSPALSGTTLEAGQQHHQHLRQGRRAAPPPNLDLDRPVMASGLIRSRRPSVSDWAHGTESDESPSTDELRLDPQGLSTPMRTPISPGSVKAGREMANRSMADLDFMTSALKE